MKWAGQEPIPVALRWAQWVLPNSVLVLHQRGLQLGGIAVAHIAALRRIVGAHFPREARIPRGLRTLAGDGRSTTGDEQRSDDESQHGLSPYGWESKHGSATPINRRIFPPTLAHIHYKFPPPAQSARQAIYCEAGE